MSETADGAKPSHRVWQPFTFGGLTVIARQGYGRILLAEILTAMLISGAVVYFLQRDYAPVILRAVQQMPSGAKISNGSLKGIDTSLIAESKFLAIAVTPEVAAPIGQTADLQVQFRPSDYRVGSVFRPDWGWESDYEPGKELDLSQAALEPWWGAWRPVILAAVAVTTFFTLFLSWTVLASIYCVPIKLIAFFGDRSLLWGECWLLCSGALLSGALLAGLGILLYAWQAVDLIGLSVFWLAHVVVGWVFCIGGAVSCPRNVVMKQPRNPFDK